MLASKFWKDKLERGREQSDRGNSSIRGRERKHSDQTAESSAWHIAGVQEIFVELPKRYVQSTESAGH